MKCSTCGIKVRSDWGGKCAVCGTGFDPKGVEKAKPLPKVSGEDRRVTPDKS